MRSSHTIEETIREKGGFVTAKEMGSRSEYRHLLRQVKERNIPKLMKYAKALRVAATIGKYLEIQL